MFGIDFDKIKEWVGENKFVSSLIGISVGIALLFGVLIFKNFSTKKTIVAELKKENSAINELQKKYGKPTPENEEKLKDIVEANSANSKKFYDKLAKPGNHKLDLSLSSTDFGSLLTKYRDTAKATLTAGDVKFPDRSFFGFEKYIESSIKENPRAIGIALLQQEMFQWLFTGITKLGSCEIVKIHREVQPEENEDRTAPIDNPPLSRGLKFDLVMKMNETQYTQFFNTLTNSDKYLIKINYLKIINDNPTAQAMPKMMDGEISRSSSEVEENQFNFVDEGTSTEETQTRRYKPIAKKGPKFLEKVLGDEKLTVALALELVLVEEVSDLMKKSPAKKK